MCIFKSYLQLWTSIQSKMISGNVGSLLQHQDEQYEDRESDTQTASSCLTFDAMQNHFTEAPCEPTGVLLLKATRQIRPSSKGSGHLIHL